MSFTFVHAADLHLDSPLRALRVDPRLGEVLRDATLRAFTRIVDLCLTERAELLLLAGDLFDAKDRSVRARLWLRRELLRLDAAGIRTFIVHGNHDPLSEGIRGVALPPSVHVFGPQWSEVPVIRGETVLCRVQGISYAQEQVTENLARRFARKGPEFTVGLLHANVGGTAGHANYAPCSLADLEWAGLDYWALGHVHTRAELPVGLGGAVAVYPGNPQGRHVNETGERGCVVVTVDGRIPTRRFVALDPVRWHRLEIDLRGVADISALIDRVEEVADGACTGTHEAHVARVTVTGRGPLHAELSEPENRAHLEEELVNVLAGRPVPVALESLEVRTRPALDLDALVRAGGLPAELLVMAEEAHVRDAGARSPWAEDELRALDQKLNRLGVAPTRDQAVAIVERAVDRALALLVEGA